ncbi:unnamed protein product [Schistosoma margrebowiei]|uniref:Uncharacterized protein n=1 Tax=Schistosoma margrebowiei TaxID=48269 RepID=A0A183MZX9_9TREM|nr:unnamed protein product [Schistosoma margrebowiei]
MRQLYDTTKLTGKYRKPERPVKDRESKTITQIRGQKDRWVEYFEELLNSLDLSDIEAAHTDFSIDTTPPTIEQTTIRRTTLHYILVTCHQ